MDDIVSNRPIKLDKETDRFPKIIFAVFLNLSSAILNYRSQVFYSAVKTGRHAFAEEVSDKASNSTVEKEKHTTGKPVYSRSQKRGEKIQDTGDFHDSNCKLDINVHKARFPAYSRC
jgi:hypothetical protein